MYRIVIQSLVLALILSSCASTGTTTKEHKDYQTIELSDNEVAPENNLESYLNRIAGVRVNGSGQNATVQVRGVNSFGGSTQPLFVLNGTDIGSNYSNAASSVRNLKIKSVRVLKGSDATLYGVRGAGGVVVIITK